MCRSRGRAIKGRISLFKRDVNRNVWLIAWALTLALHAGAFFVFQGLPPLQAVAATPPRPEPIQLNFAKPAPDAYLVAAQALGAEPGDCVVIEDAPAGVRAGRAAGMTVWAVTTTHTEAELEEADRTAADLAALLEPLGLE